MASTGGPSKAPPAKTGEKVGTRKAVQGEKVGTKAEPKKEAKKPESMDAYAERRKRETMARKKK